ncbi:uncharacterized protein LOC115999496 [Ipomoea triloba]|uniref:uncharacterized protein LOC115999496 n=1 Tax=Ipomoea triloba TaxID=35885 RepID=UPI00125DAD46|nr:uncharacterized protein LOC115999496 [Ipomoea triloba]
MDQEFNALLHNDTWCLVPVKPGMNVIGCKWVFRTKRKTDRIVEHHKARLVAKGFNQVFLLVYVDDILLIGLNSNLISSLLQRLSIVFKIRDLGTPSFFLGIEIVFVDGGA